MKQFRKRETGATPVLRFQLPLQNFADERGIGFAFGELHHLAFERIERGNFAGLVIGHGIRIGGDGFVAEFFKRKLQLITLRLE